MALPRPGKVNPVAEATATVPETLPELQQAAAVVDDAPPLGAPPLGAPPLGASTLQAEPEVNPIFQPPANMAPPFDAEAGMPPEMTLVESAPVQQATVQQATVQQTPVAQPTQDPPAAVQPPLAQTPPAMAQPPQTLAPPTQGIPQPSQVTTAPAPAVDHRAMMGAGGQQMLAEMGFEGLDGGFGDFPSVKLQEGQFQTSEGDMLGQTFACVIHSSEAKYIMKSGPEQDAEFKYTKDKRVDSSGASLESTLAVWRAQGILAPDAAPIFKAYADITAQLFDVNTKELGAVVLLSVPETSIGRVRGYMKTLAIAEQLHPSQVITQVYMAPKVTSVKHPFHPWGMKKWALLSDVGA